EPKQSRTSPIYAFHSDFWNQKSEKLETGKNRGQSKITCFGFWFATIRRLKIDYEITEQDFLDAQRLAMKELGPLVRAVRWYMPMVGSVMLIWLLIDVRHIGFDPRLLFGLAVALFFIANPGLTRHKQKKMYSSASAMHGRLSAEFDDQGVRFSGPNHNESAGWQNYRTFAEDSRMFLLWQPTRVFNPIPKRHLSSQQIEQLRTLLSAQLRQR